MLPSLGTSVYDVDVAIYGYIAMTSSSEPVCIVCQQVIPVHIRHHLRKLCDRLECKRIRDRGLCSRSDIQRRRLIRKDEADRGKEMVACAVCGEKFEIIQYSHLKRHGLRMDDYKRIYPERPLMTDYMKSKRGKGSLIQSRYLQYEGKPIDEEFLQFFAGALLGDGSLEKQKNKKNARYAEGSSNQAYLQWKCDFIRQYMHCTFNEKLSAPHVKSGKQYLGWWLRTSVHPDLTELHKLWYRERKVLPYLYLERYLTEFALAVWFCDDGYAAPDGGSAYLYTHCFSLSEVEYLFVILHSKFKLPNKILFNKDKQPFIRFGRDSATRLRKIVAEFTLPGMEYKYQ